MIPIAVWCPTNALYAVGVVRKLLEDIHLSLVFNFSIGIYVACSFLFHSFCLLFPLKETSIGPMSFLLLMLAQGLRGWGTQGRTKKVRVSHLPSNQSSGIFPNKNKTLPNALRATLHEPWCRVREKGAKNEPFTVMFCYSLLFTINLLFASEKHTILQHLKKFTVRNLRSQYSNMLVSISLANDDFITPCFKRQEASNWYDVSLNGVPSNLRVDSLWRPKPRHTA